MAYDKLKPEQIYNIIESLPDDFRFKTITFSVDGSGDVISPGLKGYIVSPYAATIEGWYLIADTAGSCEIDIWKSNSIPTGANTITASDRPKLVSLQVATDSVLTGWTTNINEGDIIAFNVVSSSIITKINLTIKIKLI